MDAMSSNAQEDLDLVEKVKFCVLSSLVLTSRE